MSVEYESLLRAWFGADLDDPRSVAERSREWFGGDPSFDDLLRKEFGGLCDAAIRGDLASWRNQARSSLALVIALDQLPRNLFRDSPKAYRYDSAALEASRHAVARGFDAALHPVEAAFVYLPFEHAEASTVQDESIALYRALLARAPVALRGQFASYLSYAERHREVIRRFGRFPHRNEVLGRASTPEELAYLRGGGENFAGSESVA